MRILTRGDFDGLASSVLLTEVEEVEEIRFAHPKDAQDGQVEVDSRDIVVNLPFIEGCGIWFDHHVSEEKSAPAEFQGSFQVAPSAARVIFNHYAPDQADRLERFGEMLEAADRLDAARLTFDEVRNPTGWILLGLTLDPRTGLGGAYRDYFRRLVDDIKSKSIDEILEDPDVKVQSDRILSEQEDHNKLLQNQTKLDENVIVTDLRGVKEKPIGNRFLVYTLHPEGNVEMRLIDGHQGKTVVAVGHSIFNRTCPVNVGELMKEFGGGGHRGAGTAQLEADAAGNQIGEILARLKSG